MKRETLKNFKKRVLREKDTLFPTLFIDPFSIRLAYFITKHDLKISATQITLFRLFLIFPLIILLLFLAPFFDLNIFYLFVAILFYLALFTDWLDGQVARATNSVSRSGAVLDSISDRFGIIIFFILIFSIGLLWDNLLVMGGAILLFAFKTFHMIIIAMMVYYDKGQTKDKDAFFTEEPAKKAMGIKATFSFIKKISKYIRIKRWNGTIAAVEQYFLTMIVFPLLVFFNLKDIVTYLAYFFIVFFSLFYLFRINSLLGTCKRIKGGLD